MQRATWTDERLDDYSEDVDVRLEALNRHFDRIDASLHRLSVMATVGSLAIMTLLGVLLGTLYAGGS